jgi:hypothetical protein
MVPATRPARPPALAAIAAVLLLCVSPLRADPAGVGGRATFRAVTDIGYRFSELLERPGLAEYYPDLAGWGNGVGLLFQGMVSTGSFLLGGRFELVGADYVLTQVDNDVAMVLMGADAVAELPLLRTLSLYAFGGGTLTRLYLVVPHDLEGSRTEGCLGVRAGVGIEWRAFAIRLGSLRLDFAVGPQYTFGLLFPKGLLYPYHDPRLVFTIVAGRNEDKP